MRLHITKNIHFTRLVKSNDRLREFNFRKLPTGAEELFHVDVTDDRGFRIIFKMQKENNQWKIVPQAVPQWVSDSEPRLHEAIEQEIS